MLPNDNHWFEIKGQNGIGTGFFDTREPQGTVVPCPGHFSRQGKT